MITCEHTPEELAEYDKWRVDQHYKHHPPCKECGYIPKMINHYMAESNPMGSEFCFKCNHRMYNPYEAHCHVCTYKISDLHEDIINASREATENWRMWEMAPNNNVKQRIDHQEKTRLAMNKLDSALRRLDEK